MTRIVSAVVAVWCGVALAQTTAEKSAKADAEYDAGEFEACLRSFEALGSGRIRSAPFNVSFLLALAMAWLVWLLIWRTRLGYEIRTMGFSPKAARYAGISEVRITIAAMLVSGALAGMMSINAVMGHQHNVYVDLAGGAGFIGIAVALMGRAHPVGIVLAAILFGVLYQGGAELAFEMPAISRDMIVIIQGLVILFAGALEHMFRPYIQMLFASFSPKSVGLAAAKGGAD